LLNLTKPPKAGNADSALGIMLGNLFLGRYNESGQVIETRTTAAIRDLKKNQPRLTGKLLN